MATSKSNAAKKKTANVTNQPSADLKAIVDATLQNSFVYLSAEATAQLVAEGLVETNPAMADANGGIATRATQKGIDSMNTAANQAAASQPATSTGAGEAQISGNGAGEIVIEDNVPIPAVSGRGRSGQSVYPFDKLNVGQSFFVAKPAKNLASTVSSANARFAEEIPGQFKTNKKTGQQVPATRQLRQFVVRSVTEKGVKGSRVWRVEPKNDAA
ncbi:MAG TPA: hypothetical protein VHK27_05575 [Gammaproteobacteria bacterium]|nr:hypothetical protein [Gammaproteobacteria bacterium]